MSKNISFSFWEQQSFFQQVDFAIIGSGIVGLNAAIRLKELRPNSRVLVLESGILPTGASTRNAGFACFGSMTELLDDLKSMSRDEVFALVEKRWRGLQKLRVRLGDKQLNYKNLGGYELFTEQEAAIFQKCQENLTAFNQEMTHITGMRQVYQTQSKKIKAFGFAGIQQLIWNAAEGQINTGQMMVGLLKLARSKGVEIINGLHVTHFEQQQNQITIHALSISNNQSLKLKAHKVILATNGFTKRLFPNLNIQPARNQVLITHPIPDLNIKGTFHYEQGYVYFRNVGNRLLLGGFRHLGKLEETTDQFGESGIIQSALEHFLHTTLFPQQKVLIEHRWSGILGVGTTKKPIVAMIENNIFAAVRLGGMGVAIGSLVGEEVAELVLEIGQSDI